MTLKQKGKKSLIATSSSKDFYFFLKALWDVGGPPTGPPTPHPPMCEATSQITASLTTNSCKVELVCKYSGAPLKADGDQHSHKPTPDHQQVIGVFVTGNTNLNSEWKLLVQIGVDVSLAPEAPANPRELEKNWVLKTDETHVWISRWSGFGSVCGQFRS